MAGDSFQFLSAAGGVSGQFDTLNLPTLSGDLQWELAYGANDVTLSVMGGMLDGDFDDDGDLDGADIDALVDIVAAMSHDSLFDLTGDGLVDADDLGEWLVLGGAANLPSGAAYIMGDANLDGVVDISDFNTWNSHKFTSTGAWTRGDFSADGFTDISDFNVWNSNKFSAADAGTQAVPQPAAGLLIVLGVWAMLSRSRVKV